MTVQEFYALVDEVFDHTYGAMLIVDQRLPSLANMNAVEALEAGEEPRVVWNLLCEHLDIPDSQRWGKDHQAPPLPAVFRQ